MEWDIIEKVDTVDLGVIDMPQVKGTRSDLE